jgi:GntR family transcriptional repressor for pyruvate dehydrogenase complex
MTIANLIADQVREALFQDRLKSGDFVGTEQEIANQFRVSRIAARDALRTLEASGVISVRPGPGGGARIAQGNPTRFAEALAIQLKLVAVTEYEIYVAQHAIEAMAVEHAARNADTADLDALEELIREAQSLRYDIPAFKRSCFDFHAALTEASHNRVLIALRTSIDKVLPDAYAGDPSPQHLNGIINHHRKILQLVRAGDGATAGSQMRKHLCQMESWLKVKSQVELASPARRAPAKKTARSKRTKR